MKNYLVLLFLVMSCAVITKHPPVQEAPIATEVMKPVEQSPAVAITPVEVTPRGQLRLKPALKYTVSVVGYDKYIPRVEKFFELLVNDKTILDSHQFKYTTDSPDKIRSKIMEGFDVKLTSFRPTWYNALKWKYTIAYHDDWTIYLNDKKLNRPDCEVINTIAHESTHAWGYGHGNDSPYGKGDSVPYWIGNKAEELCLAGTI